MRIFTVRVLRRNITTYHNCGEYYFVVTSVADLIGVSAQDVLSFCHNLDPSYNSLLYVDNEYNIPSPIAINVKLLGRYLMQLAFNNNDKAKQLLEEIASEYFILKAEKTV